jgi:glutamate N-acetyltransferase/amino-acid N-acetyltransferase
MSDLHLLSPKGFVASGIYAGIKTRQIPDIGLLICRAATAATAAAAFTTNKVFAAPVKIGRKHIASGKLRGVVVNSGNANACTGKQGERDALRMCDLAANVARCKPTEILPSSTGIIGHLLPMQKIERGIAEAGLYLGDSAEHAHLFGDAIMTTDTRRKTAATTFTIGKQTVTLAGVCKGAGMIGPRMATAAPHATLLAYLTTDALITAPVLKKLMQQATDESFNSVTIDDHTSTNDTAVLLASGISGAKVAGAKAIASFAAAMKNVCQFLAYQIAADGEGATKVVTVTVRQAKTVKHAQAMARAIANSPLVKCAMNGNDPNWGRIVSAAGLAGVPFNPDKATLTLQGTVVFKNGQPLPFDAVAVSDSLKTPEVKVDLTCRLGKSDATVWTCDLSKDYVTINADYHT